MDESNRGTLEHHAVEPFPKVFKVVALSLFVYLAVIFISSGTHVALLGGGHP